MLAHYWEWNSEGSIKEAVCSCLYFFLGEVLDADRKEEQGEGRLSALAKDENSIFFLNHRYKLDSHGNLPFRTHMHVHTCHTDITTHTKPISLFALFISTCTHLCSGLR